MYSSKRIYLRYTPFAIEPGRKQMDASSDTGQNEAPLVAVLGYYNKRAGIVPCTPFVLCARPPTPRRKTAQWTAFMVVV